MKVLQFITAIPWDVYRGSGCYVGTRALVEAVRRPGIRVEVTQCFPYQAFAPSAGSIREEKARQALRVEASKQAKILVTRLPRK